MLPVSIVFGEGSVREAHVTCFHGYWVGHRGLVSMGFFWGGTACLFPWFLKGAQTTFFPGLQGGLTPPLASA